MMLTSTRHCRPLVGRLLLAERCCAVVQDAQPYVFHSQHYRCDNRDRRRQRSTSSHALSGIVVGSICATVAGVLYHRKSIALNQKVEPEPEPDAGSVRPVARPDLPTYRADEVNRHSSRDSVWVTYGAGVYDITTFVAQHPGNVTNIMMAAGSAIDPFWHTFQQHKTPAVLALLEQFRIGNLHADDVLSDADLFDPWSSEPARHAMLRPTSKRPFNAEPPADKLVEQFVTPSEMFYVRNHLPVPVIIDDEYELSIECEGEDSLCNRTLRMADLHKLPKHDVTVTIMCGGNRRSEMHAVRPVRGLHWGQAAVGTAVWSGPKLCDILAEMGVRSDDTRHVHFEGLDVDATAEPYAASIPLYKAMDPRGDVILAYEMNGEPLPRDHGYPVRVVVPGVVGARHVKWLGRIRVTSAECPSHWQQGDYKGFSPSTDWDTVDFSRSTSMQNMPVTSAICNVRNGSVVNAVDGCVEVKGYAWSGGGQKILRVDLTADQGRTWHVAELEHAPGEAGKLPTGRNWAWSLWRARIPIPAGESIDGVQPVEIWSKAVDANYNVQPETFENTWNLRGVLSHAYCRVKVMVART